MTTEVPVLEYEVENMSSNETVNHLRFPSQYHHYAEWMVVNVASEKYTSHVFQKEVGTELDRYTLC